MLAEKGHTCKGKVDTSFVQQCLDCQSVAIRLLVVLQAKTVA